MFDIWGFLLQTLTVSGVAVLLLVIKVLFKDKLPPKWHFAVWGVLGIMILIPAGFNGRYTILQWQLVVTNIIDEDAPVEDCTTMHQPRRQKKNTGPVMGGM